MPRTTISLTLALATLAGIAPLSADPPAGEKWRPVPSLSDEFNGRKLNSTKWHDHAPGWIGRAPGLFVRENVTVGDGNLQLAVRSETVPNSPEGYHSFTCAAINGKQLIRYGYFEVRAKPAKCRAASSFWLFNNTPNNWTEIDGFELNGAEPRHMKIYHMDAHVFHTPTIKRTDRTRLMHSAEWKAPVVLADDYHVYGLEWNEKEIVWYYDGEPVRRLPNKYWFYPLKIVFDTQTINNWFGTPRKENLPAVFNVDYIRVWKRDSELSALYDKNYIPFYHDALGPILGFPSEDSKQPETSSPETTSSVPVVGGQ